MFPKLLLFHIATLLSVNTLVRGANLGQWGPLIEFPLVPVAAALLHDTGELLVWSAYSTDTFGPGVSGQTQTAIYNPATGAVTKKTITNTQHDMFCPGISVDFNGGIIVTGGDTAAKASIYNVTGNDWIAAPDMKIPRGYQASATLSDGRIFVIGGSWSGGRGGKNGEIYDPTKSSWSLLPGCPVAPMLTADNAGVYRQDNHGWLFAWKNGYVFQAGPSKHMNWYGTTGSGSQTAAGLRAGDTDSMAGDAIMYDAVAGKILTVGGAPDYNGSSSTRNAHVITIGTPGSTPSVVQINTMWYARAFSNGVVLPDGKVFIAGGQTFTDPFTDNNAILTPELWDPTTTKFVKMAPNQTPRTYHSVGLLMPDGTVFVGGGGLCGSCHTNHFDGQFYSPPYLFASDGVAQATRPAISSLSATTVKIGGSIAVTMAGAVNSFSLIRMGSTTHTVNTDQRRIPLTPTVSGLNYTITVPGDAGVALPGYWMLFALDSAGVPSLAKTVLITL